MIQRELDMQSARVKYAAHMIEQLKGNMRFQYTTNKMIKILKKFDGEPTFVGKPNVEDKIPELKKQIEEKRTEIDKLPKLKNKFDQVSQKLDSERQFNETLKVVLEK